MPDANENTTQEITYEAATPLPHAATPLPHPELSRVAYGELLSPNLWNNLATEVEDNLASLATAAILVAATTVDLATRPAASTGGALRLALVVSEMTLFVYVEGETDIAISELEYANSLARVAAPAGAWYRVQFRT